MMQRISRGGQQWTTLIYTTCICLALGSSMLVQAKSNKYKVAPIGTLPTPIDEISVWQRAAGNYTTKKKPSKWKEKSYKLRKLRKQVKTLLDVQFQKKATFKGFYIRDLLKQYRVPKGLDLALLHFDNKIVIPYPLGKKALRVFVALAWKDKRKWNYKFPSLRKKDALFRDKNPIVFRGNKVVVTKQSHPYVAKKLRTALNIWRYANSIRGIELVQKAAYYKQFSAAKTTPMVQIGYRSFMGSCQFCHGVRKVGAGFGIDFTKPVSVHLYLNRPTYLRHHIRNRSLFATREGLMMPSIKNISKKEAKAIWMWMQAVWRMKKPHAYQPTKATK